MQIPAAEMILAGMAYLAAFAALKGPTEALIQRHFEENPPRALKETRTKCDELGIEIESLREKLKIKEKRIGEYDSEIKSQKEGIKNFKNWLHNDEGRIDIATRLSLFLEFNKESHENEK